MGMESTQDLGGSLDYITKRLHDVTVRVEALDFGIEKRILDIVERESEKAKEDIHRDLERTYVSQTELDQAFDEAGFIDEKGVEGIVTEALDAALQEDGTVENITRAAVVGAMRGVQSTHLWSRLEERVAAVEGRLTDIEGRSIAGRGLRGRLRWLLTGK